MDKDVTRAVNEYLEQVKDEGLPGFKVICDARNNAPSNIEQGKLNVMLEIPTWITEQRAQEREDGELAWPRMPTHGPVLARYQAFAERFNRTASVVPGFDGSIGWFLASDKCSLYVDFLPDERVRVYWNLDAIEAMFDKGAKLRHEEILPATTTLDELADTVKLAYGLVCQAIETDAAVRSICEYEDKQWRDQVGKILDEGN